MRLLQFHVPAKECHIGQIMCQWKIFQSHTRAWKTFHIAWLIVKRSYIIWFTSCICWRYLELNSNIFLLSHGDHVFFHSRVQYICYIDRWWLFRGDFQYLLHEDNCQNDYCDDYMGNLKMPHCTCIQYLSVVTVCTVVMYTNIASYHYSE